MLNSLIDKNSFKTGYCAEFAFALSQQFKINSFGFIQAKIKDKDTKENFIEICHVCIIDKNNPNIYYDVNGKNIFDKNDANFLFSNSVLSKNILLKQVTIDDVENEFGFLEPLKIQEATIFIQRNINLYQDLKLKSPSKTKTKTKSTNKGIKQ